MKTATNPQAGQKVYWDGEQWLPLKTATNKETGEVIGIVNGETFTVTPPRPREPESMRQMITDVPERFRETRERYVETVAGDVPVSRFDPCLLYTSPSPRDGLLSRMPSSA